MSRLLWLLAAATLLVAGVVSHAASASPDGLDATTLRGCEVVETADGEELRGQCIAQRADDHALAGSPFADYTVGGDAALGGIAGVLGAAVTLAAACLLFRLLVRRRS